MSRYTTSVNCLNATFKSYYLPQAQTRLYWKVQKLWAYISCITAIFMQEPKRCVDEFRYLTRFFFL